MSSIVSIRHAVCSHLSSGPAGPFPATLARYRDVTKTTTTDELSMPSVTCEVTSPCRSTYSKYDEFGKSRKPGKYR